MGWLNSLTLGIEGKEFNLLKLRYTSFSTETNLNMRSICLMSSDSSLSQLVMSGLFDGNPCPACFKSLYNSVSSNPLILSVMSNIFKVDFFLHSGICKQNIYVGDQNCGTTAIGYHNRSSSYHAATNKKGNEEGLGVQFMAV